MNPKDTALITGILIAGLALIVVTFAILRMLGVL